MCNQRVNEEPEMTDKLADALKPCPHCTTKDKVMMQHVKRTQKLSAALGKILGVQVKLFYGELDYKDYRRKVRKIAKDALK